MVSLGRKLAEAPGQSHLLSGGAFGSALGETLGSWGRAAVGPWELLILAVGAGADVAPFDL